MGTIRRAVALVAVAVVPTSCVGSVSQAAFDDEVRARGGGIGQDLPLDALDAVESSLGVRELSVRSLTVTPGQVQVEVLVPGSAGDLDSYRYGTSGMYGGRGLSGPEPVAVSAQGPPIEAQLFPAAEAGLDRLDAMVDDALERAGLDGGYAQAAVLTRAPDGRGAVTAVTVTNQRSTVTVELAPDGSVTGVEPS